MKINQENDDKYCVTAYNRVLDKERFEEQVIGGEAGYYDNVEKVFIPERVFLSLFKEIMPEVDDHSVDNNYEVHLDSLVQKSFPYKQGFVLTDIFSISFSKIFVT